MTYYDWEVIFKNKSIFELKEIIKNGFLGKDAIHYAAIELINRYYNESTLSQNTFDSIEHRIEILISNGNLNEGDNEFLKHVLLHIDN